MGPTKHGPYVKITTPGLSLYFKELNRIWELAVPPKIETRVHYEIKHTKDMGWVILMIVFNEIMHIENLNLI